MGLSAIGPVVQFAFVPTDFDAALRHWTQVMGVGPFYVIENIALGDMRFLGQPSDCVFTIAIAYWGDVQIELIRQENEAPSHFNGEYARHGDVLHHTCVFTDDIVAARAVAEGVGGKVLVEGKIAPDGHVLYVDTGGGPGRIVEILQPASGSDALFAMIREASRNWDGAEPLRKLDFSV